MKKKFSDESIIILSLIMGILVILILSSVDDKLDRIEAARERVRYCSMPGHADILCKGE